MSMKRRDFYPQRRARRGGSSEHCSCGSRGNRGSGKKERSRAEHFHEAGSSSGLPVGVPGTEYYFIGNGFVQAVLQSSEKPENGTHCGLFFMSPEHFCARRARSCFIRARRAEHAALRHRDDRAYLPEFAMSTIFWEYPDGIPTIVLEWMAGAVRVREEYWCPIGSPALVRRMTLCEHRRAGAGESDGAALPKPHALRRNMRWIRERFTLTAKGFADVSLFSKEATASATGNLYFDFGTMNSNATREAVRGPDARADARRFREIVAGCFA